MNPLLDVTIDADICRARTLPATAYADPTVFEAERGVIFRRTWQWIGDIDLVKTPRDVHPFTLFEHCVDEPLLLVRGDDDVIRCLSNVCTHRGNLVCEQAGRAAHLRCRYHGRRFGLDGRFEHMPEFEQVSDFPSDADNLASVPHEIWRQFLFVGIDPQRSLREVMAEIETRIGWLPIESARHDPSRSRDYLVNANWKLYCDNYLEGFHIPSSTHR